jgi:hypothetical protein
LGGCIEGMDRVIGPFPSNPSGPPFGIWALQFYLGNFLPDIIHVDKAQLYLRAYQYN